MAILNKAAYLAKYNDAGVGRFKTGQTRGIGSDDMRDFTQDTKDSVVFPEDIITELTREFNRTFSDDLLFDKNEIHYAPTELSGDLNYTLAGSGQLANQFCSIIQEVITDGTHQVNFTGFKYIFPRNLNGSTPGAGTHLVTFLYFNGVAIVNWPEPSSEEANFVLSAPGSFAAVADGENAIDLSWVNVTGNQGYLIEYSLDGLTGWTTLETTAVDAVAATQTGLAVGDIRYYRIKTLGNGTSSFDSSFSTVVSAQTEDAGDVTAPTFSFAPPNGNNVWPVNKTIGITANEPIRNTDGSEITNANVATRIILKETNAGGADIPFTATIDGSKLVVVITPDTHYGVTQLVYVAINNVEDVNGNEVTVAESITFTTTDYTFLNGVNNRLQFGDILDALLTANDTNFWIEITVNNPLISGTRALVTKSVGAPQNCFHLYYTGADIFFTYWMTNTPGTSRTIKWTGALVAGESVLVLKYDGAIDTNNGLDRVILLVDGGTAGSKTLYEAVGALTGSLANSNAQLAVGGFIQGGGTPSNSAFYTEEMKDFIIRSAAGATVEINVPLLVDGQDTSGNARNGTWV